MQPIGFDCCVIVEERNVVVPLGQWTIDVVMNSKVASSCESEILKGFKNDHIWKFVASALRNIVKRTIIDQHDFIAFTWPVESVQ